MASRPSRASGSCAPPADRATTQATGALGQRKAAAARVNEVRRPLRLCASGIGAREDVLTTPPFRSGSSPPPAAPASSGSPPPGGPPATASARCSSRTVSPSRPHAGPGRRGHRRAEPARVPVRVLSPPAPPRAGSVEVHSMSALNPRPLELGLGTGRPQAAEEAAQLGMPWGSGAERLDRVRETVVAVRPLDPDRRIPLLIAAAGPRAPSWRPPRPCSLHPRRAACDPASAGWRDGGPGAQLAGPRAAQLEWSMNVFVLGDEAPPFMAGIVADPAARTGDTLAFLRGSPRDMADELRRRRTGSARTQTSPSARRSRTGSRRVIELLTGRADCPGATGPGRRARARATTIGARRGHTRRQCAEPTASVTVTATARRIQQEEGGEVARSRPVMSFEGGEEAPANPSPARRRSVRGVRRVRMRSSAQSGSDRWDVVVVGGVQRAHGRRLPGSAPAVGCWCWSGPSRSAAPGRVDGRARPRAPVPWVPARLSRYSYLVNRPG